MTPDLAPLLAAGLPQDTLRDLAPRYLEEPRGRWHGRARGLAAPADTAQVAAVIRACAATGTPVIPYGGGTGLVGGQLAEGGTPPLILSLERMRAVRALDAAGGTMTVEAGAILSEVHDAAEAAGRLFPLTLASQGSARIGGLLATNAGGVNVLRYGNARDLCLGVEAVLADGAVTDMLSPLRKNNMGYDLRHLLIGSEGTLGVITAATLRLFPRPAATGAALMVVPDPAAALALLGLAQAQIGEGLSAFEAGAVTDGLIASSEAQRQEFWTLRETIPLANRRIGAVSSHDISVPVAAIPRFIAEAPSALAPIGAFRVNCFGHLGDGNLHYNVFPPEGRAAADFAADRAAIKRAIHDLTHALGGSVSAEHGIGRLKVDDLERYGDPAKLAAMRAIKAALDPQGILNPGAVLRA